MRQRVGSAGKWEPAGRAKRAYFDLFVTADKGRRIAIVVLSTPQWPRVRMASGWLALAHPAFNFGRLMTNRIPLHVSSTAQILKSTKPAVSADSNASLTGGRRAASS